MCFPIGKLLKKSLPGTGRINGPGVPSAAPRHERSKYSNGTFPPRRDGDCGADLPSVYRPEDAAAKFECEALEERQLKVAGKPTEREADLQELIRRRREHEKFVEQQREVMEA